MRAMSQVKIAAEAQRNASSTMHEFARKCTIGGNRFNCLSCRQTLRGRTSSGTSHFASECPIVPRNAPAHAKCAKGTHRPRAAPHGVENEPVPGSSQSLISVGLYVSS